MASARLTSAMYVGLVPHRHRLPPRQQAVSAPQFDARHRGDGISHCEMENAAAFHKSTDQRNGHSIFCVSTYESNNEARGQAGEAPLRAGIDDR